ncbi:hypothetical protein BC828DRAFT_376016 [Blastocladiella britannica]|nr:hypothetical protein BC828DRAFT_376016 [Blastocladiella britannica]
MPLDFRSTHTSKRMDLAPVVTELLSALLANRGNGKAIPEASFHDCIASALSLAAHTHPTAALAALDATCDLAGQCLEAACPNDSVLAGDETIDGPLALLVLRLAALRSSLSALCPPLSPLVATILQSVQHHLGTIHEHPSTAHGDHEEVVDDDVLLGVLELLLADSTLWDSVLGSDPFSPILIRALHCNHIIIVKKAAMLVSMRCAGTIPPPSLAPLLTNLATGARTHPHLGIAATEVFSAAAAGSLSPLKIQAFEVLTIDPLVSAMVRRRAQGALAAAADQHIIADRVLPRVLSNPRTAGDAVYLLTLIADPEVRVAAAEAVAAAVAPAQLGLVISAVVTGGGNGSGAVVWALSTVEARLVTPNTTAVLLPLACVAEALATVEGKGDGLLWARLVTCVGSALAMHRADDRWVGECFLALVHVPLTATTTPYGQPWWPEVRETVQEYLMHTNMALAAIAERVWIANEAPSSPPPPGIPPSPQLSDEDASRDAIAQLEELVATMRYYQELHEHKTGQQDDDDDRETNLMDCY